MADECERSRRRSSRFLKSAWLATVVSLGLHGFLLLLPIAPDHKTPPVKPTEKSVRITQLSKLSKPAPRQLPKVLRPQKPKLARPSQAKPVSPPAPPSKPSQESKPDSTANPWQDFPKYPGGVPGCFNLTACVQSSDDIKLVSTFFNTELKAKKYEAALTKDEPDRKIYQVSRNNLTQYLNLFIFKGTTLYVLSPKELTLAELTKAKAVPPEIDAIFAGVDAQEVAADSFTQPELFYTGGQLRSDIIDARFVKNLDASTTAETFFDAFIKGNLQSSQFDVPEESQPYGGGAVYVATKGNASFYINVVPTKDKEGGIIVIWQKPPK
ncbi:MAG: hypothetical protein ACAF41_11190 [Leptolyngbya sp. BL-A-14]